jgi:hypothetical protein
MYCSKRKKRRCGKKTKERKKKMSWTERHQRYLEPTKIFNTWMQNPETAKTYLEMKPLQKGNLIPQTRSLWQTMKGESKLDILKEKFHKQAWSNQILDLIYLQAYQEDGNQSSWTTFKQKLENTIRDKSIEEKSIRGNVFIYRFLHGQLQNPKQIEEKEFTLLFPTRFETLTHPPTYGLEEWKGFLSLCIRNDKFPLACLYHPHVFNTFCQLKMDLLNGKEKQYDGHLSERDTLKVLIQGSTPYPNVMPHPEVVNWSMQSEVREETRTYLIKWVKNILDTKPRRLWLPRGDNPDLDQPSMDSSSSPNDSPATRRTRSIDTNRNTSSSSSHRAVHAADTVGRTVAAIVPFPGLF